MPRNARVHYTHAFYHVMLQGNYRQAIFHSDSDYDRFYEILKKVTAQYNCRIHLFCLMTNHIHLLVEVEHIPLKKIIQVLTSTYSNYMNKKLERQGHLFRGRYLEKIVEDKRYMLELFYYIHMNPVKAMMVKTLSDYSWSSYHCYTKIKKLDWMTTDVFQELIVQETGYQDITEFFKIDRDEYYAEAKFCKLDEKEGLIIESKNSFSFRSSEGLDLRCLSLSEIVKVVCSSFSISFHVLLSDSKKQVIITTRMLAAYYAHYYGMYQMKHIAQLLQCPVDTLSKTLHRQLCSEKKKIKLKAKMEQVERDFLEIILKNKK